MTIKFFAVAALVTVGAYGGAKYGWPAATRAIGPRIHPTVQAPSRARPAAVTPLPATTLSNEEEAWTGVLLTQAVDLTARIESKVKGYSFRVGDVVRADDPLAELDTTSQQHDIAAAEAALRASQAEAWSASVSVSQAKDRQSRRSRMFRVGTTDIPLVSQEELADSKFDALSASSRASAASASADERRARLAYLHQVVKDATIRAPFEGVVATRYVEVGGHVRQGMPVVRIVGRGALRVRFAVPETEAGTLRLQSRVAIQWDDRTLYGTVDRIAPEVESASSSIVMEALIDAALPDGNERSALAGRVVGVRVARDRQRG